MIIIFIVQASYNLFISKVEVEVEGVVEVKRSEIWN